MSSDLTPISAKLSEDALRKLEEIRERLQAERPGVPVSRTDALRHCIYSLSADFRMSPLPTSIELEGDETKAREEKDAAKGGD